MLDRPASLRGVELAPELAHTHPPAHACARASFCRGVGGVGVLYSKTLLSVNSTAAARVALTWLSGVCECRVPRFVEKAAFRFLCMVAQLSQIPYGVPKSQISGQSGTVPQTAGRAARPRGLTGTTQLTVSHPRLKPADSARGCDVRPSPMGPTSQFDYVFARTSRSTSCAIALRSPSSDKR